MNSIQTNYGITKNYLSEAPTPETTTTPAPLETPTKPAFRAAMPQDAYVQTAPQQNGSFLKRNWGKLLTLAVVAGLALHPKTRFMAKNLFGKKGCAEFLKGSADNSLKDVIKKLQSIKGFDAAIEGLSSSNITKLAQTVKGNEELFSALISGKMKAKIGADAIQALVDIEKTKGYDLLNAVNSKKDLVNSIAKYVKTFEATPDSIKYTKESSSELSVSVKKLLSTDPDKKTAIIKKAESKLNWSDAPEFIRHSFIKKTPESIIITI